MSNKPIEDILKSWTQIFHEPEPDEEEEYQNNFKIGEKVYILEDPEMEYEGKIATIIDEHPYATEHYLLDIDNGEAYWPSNLLESLHKRI